MPAEVQAGDDPIPAIPEWAAVYTQAWDTLRADRSLAQGVVGRIYYASVAAYARDIGLTDEPFHTFVRLVLALDEEYVQVSHERMKQELEKQKR